MPTPFSPPSRRALLWAKWGKNPGLWLAAFAFLLRLVALLKMADSPYRLFDDGDMKFYNDWALRILQGEGSGAGAFYGLPGYAYFLAAIYRVIGFDPFSIGLLQSLSDAVITVLIFKICTLIFEGKTGAWVGAIAAFGWAVFLPSQTFSIVLMPTTWLVLTFWGTVYWLLRLLRDRHASVWHPWLAIGLLFGVVAMGIATIFLLIPLVLAAIISIFKRSWGKIAGASALLFAGVLAGMSPCWIHNYFIAHEPVLLSAHSGLNFYIGNNAVANGYPKIPPGLRAGQQGMLKDSITVAEEAVGHPLTKVAVSQFWKAKAQAYIHAHPGEWLRLMATKVRNFWNRFQYDDLSLIVLFQNVGILQQGIGWGQVAALALPGLFFAAWRYPRSRWVIAAVLLHMAALLPVFVTERYRLAAMPGLLILAACTVTMLTRWLAERQWRAAGTLGAGCLAGAWFVALPVQDPGLWSLDEYNVGIRALSADDLATAERCLIKAYRYVPDNAEVVFGVGNLYFEKADPMRAKTYYRRTVELNPRHDGAYNNLGVIALQEQQFQLATAFFARSLAIEPRDAKTHFLLAKAQLALGQRAAALASAGEAHRLAPADANFLALLRQLSP